MQKRMLFFIISFVIFSFAAAENYEEVRCYQVGPGSVYTNYLERSKPWDIHVVSIDLTNPRIRLESVKAGDRKLGREVTSSMSRRSDREAHRIVSAVNGDFYNTTNGVPINNQVVNGEFVHAYTYHRSAFTYARNRKAAIVIPIFSGELVAKVDSSGDAVRHPLSTVNRDRYADYLVIYNRFMGASTGTNEWGTECLARPLSGWVVNDTVYAVIEARESGTGDMTIPGDKFVISGHGTAQTFLNEHCGVGDTVKIVQRLEGSPPGLTQLVGGGPRLLENGTEIIAAAAADEGVGTSFCTARHPRTAVGFNADSTVAYFVVVDGRQEHSAGMSLYELADFMKYIGASHATNLDGGGSSTMTVRSEVRNVPSDGWERIVANAMMCVSTAPDGDLSLIQIERDSIAVYETMLSNFRFPAGTRTTTPGDSLGVGPGHQLQRGPRRV
ncbi:MAG: phosphodiester glycosidase family protein [Candidatus Marinimicrobia bacterium]|nr:phosphodiester glycosidase family protein [Candidatus Neomarinimicrobiota bacterium]